ncbi:MAG: bifunctional diaminohydroxyphosphoribosylaminopyrimidine deaminase/5-amino-6-(5-phosphoribosylamino)uracil reductase RibD [Planctomycetota bacterium]|nr:bifunctional diaminohydroxyphosphoribosylaminopyrimidine deaminase/5-amino-6-(5-phosphoribosylamino)uracil reductase RibD [Planctomycetota bacterium]
MSSGPPDPLRMERAIELARRGLGRVAPNPPVGAVLVSGSEIAEGWHTHHGGQHAEVNCLAAARSAGIDVSGADLYVTLEPCGHHGKTPPCVEAIIEARIGRVIVSVDDPHPVTTGVGYRGLEEAGIEVVRDFLAEQGRWLTAPYLCRTRNGRPLVTAKWAMTADGKIACQNGDSRWITSEPTRAQTRQERSEIDAILVGVQTVISDDPRLTSAGSERIDPLRVVIDPTCRTPVDATILQVPSGAIIYCHSHQLDSDAAHQLKDAGVLLVGLDSAGDRIALKSLLTDLAERGVQDLLVEGGAETHGGFLEAGLIDRVQIWIAPKLVGGAGAPGPIGGIGIEPMNQAVPLIHHRWRQIGDDLLLEGAVTPEGLGEESR